jgi:D-serine deaminase-like pyridoxal phosphate-dependent protein
VEDTVGRTLAGLGTPALLVDVARVARNVSGMARRAAATGVALRTDVTACRMVEVVRLHRALGSTRAACATEAELRALRREGVEDIMWRPRGGTPATAALAAEANRGGRVTVATASIELARAMGRRAREADVVVPYAIEVDTGLGATGVPPAGVVAFARALSAVPGLRCAAVLTSETGLGPRGGDVAALAERALAASRLLAETRDRLGDAGFHGAGSCVASTAAGMLGAFAPGTTEVVCGAHAFGDANLVTLGCASWDDCAVTVLARVTGRSPGGRAVIDAGLRALGPCEALRGAGHGFVLGGGAIVRDVEEERGVLDGRLGHEIAVGSLVRIVPNVAAATAAMWSSAAAVDEGRVIDRWRVVDG